MRNMGVCYETGHGVEQDYEAALEWYCAAQSAGLENAAEDIKRVEQKMAGE